MTFTLTFVATVLVFNVLFPDALALWRLQCDGIVAQAMIDPIMSPGNVSGHVHTAKGANGFVMNATADSLMESTCTSCQVKEDHSAYWTPKLYFEADNGTIFIVPEVSGHLTYYKYTPCWINGVFTYPSAMPNGLTMISGDSYQRNFTWPIPDPPMPWSGADISQAALRQKAIGFNCLNYNIQPESSLYRHFLPTKNYVDANCPDGLRLELLFPQCWNGSLDSADHKSHLAFPDHSINGGTCPQGYDQLINQIFYETIYATATFRGQPGAFVLANGDPTGFGYHGDIIVAWDAGVLAQATKICGPDTTPGDIGASGDTTLCPVFTINSDAEMESCKVELPPSLINIKTTGPMPALAGNNPITPGPGYAKPVEGAQPVASISPSVVLPSTLPTLSYSVGSSNSNPEDGNVFNLASSTASVSGNPATSPSTTTTLAALLPNEALFTVATSLTTIAGIAYEDILVQEVVTVYMTTEAEASPLVKRDKHVYKHGRRHQHHVHGV